ncbi:MAG TPA: ribbon-helix-helix protein, CopG family [Chloroflexota bacterium]|jgi:predicted transcriptional regulator
MARSFRLDPELERRLAEAAAREGVPASALIREAVRRRCDEVLGRTLRTDLGDLVGAIQIGGDDAARRTGRAFTELLTEKPEPR